MGAIIIPIKAPNFVSSNRKGFHSINLQGIVDHEMMFTDYYVGWPGSVHDARVFRNSEIYDLATNSTSEWFPNDSHLVGDSAYPNLTWHIKTMGP